MAEILTRQSDINKLLERGRTLGHEMSGATTSQLPGAAIAGLGCTKALAGCWYELNQLIDAVQMLYYAELNAAERAVETINAADQTAARSIEQS